MVVPVRVLVVDDSLLYRKVVRDTLGSLPGVEVVGSAINGVRAIEKIVELRPDLVTLDLEMPELDGHGVLRWLAKQRLPTWAVMLSAVTREGAEGTLKALQEGALDFVVKPSGSDTEINQQTLAGELHDRIRVVRDLAELARSRNPSATRPHATPRAAPATTATSTAIHPGARRIRAVGIGVSTGGPDALRTILPRLPKDLPVPVFVVQHMPPVFTKSLADNLNALCSLPVHEASDGDLVRAGTISIAPGGRHMKVVSSPHGMVIRLTDDPPVQNCRPSADYLFDSLASAYGASVLSVLMTGMGSDGAESARRLHSLGGPVIAQDEASCVVFGMPRKAVLEGYADVVSPLDQIPHHIVRYTRAGDA